MPNAKLIVSNCMGSNGDANERFERIERVLEAMVTRHVHLEARHDAIETDFKRLLTAQIQLTEDQRALSEDLRALAETQSALAETQRATEQRLADFVAHTEERINALISIVDDLVRRTPQPPQA